MKRVILASSSPRRKILLNQIGLKFTVKASNYKEDINLNLSPVKFVEYMSIEKAKSVEKYHDDTIIIAADTIIFFRGKIIGKPKDKTDAKRILKMLSDQSHDIITGFTILDTSTRRLVTKCVKTKVYFRKLTDMEINKYVATGEPLDKAGAYGIQEKGGVFVKKIVGDYFNVVGLPIYSLAEELKKFGIICL